MASPQDQRDPYVPKRYNCAENARFDVGRPLGTISGSPVLVSKSQQHLVQALPPQYKSTASPENPVLLKLNMSPMPRSTRHRDEQDHYLAELQRLQYEEHLRAQDAYLQQQQQQQDAQSHYNQKQQQQQQQQQQQKQEAFLSSSVNRRPAQPVSLDEQRALMEKRAKQHEYMLQLDRTSAQKPIEPQRVSLMQVNAHKNRAPPESRGQSHFIDPSAPPISVQNVLTGKGAVDSMSPEQKKKAQADFVKMVEDAKNLQPQFLASPYRRQSRPPSPTPALGGTSSLSQIGLRDTPEYKRQQYEARRAIALAGLQGVHAYRTSDGSQAYTPVGTPSIQYPDLLQHPMRGSIDGYEVGTDGQYNHGGSSMSPTYLHDGDKRHSSTIAYDEMASMRGSPLKKPASMDNVPPREQHFPSPKVRAVLQRMAEADPTQAPTAEELAVEDAERRRLHSLKYALMLQQDKQTPHPAQHIERIPITSLRVANRKNEVAIETSPGCAPPQSGPFSERETNMFDAIGQYEHDSLVNKKRMQEDTARLIADSDSRPAIKAERVSPVVAARMGANGAGVGFGTGAFAGGRGMMSGGGGSSSVVHERDLDEKRHLQASLHDMAGTFDAEETLNHHLVKQNSRRQQKDESEALRAALGYGGVEAPNGPNGAMQGPNFWEGYAIQNRAGMGGPLGPGATGFLAGTSSDPVSARAKQHATHQMHYDQRAGGGGDGEYKNMLDQQLHMQMLMHKSAELQQQQQYQQQQQQIPQLKFATPALSAALQAANPSARSGGQARQAFDMYNGGGIGALAMGQSPRTGIGAVAPAGPAMGSYDPSRWTAGQQFAATQATQRQAQGQARPVYKGGFARL